MTQDERLEAALSRLSAALASLEEASRRIVDLARTQADVGLNLRSELDLTLTKAEKLEAACDEASSGLNAATEALAAILSTWAGSTGD